MKYDSIYATILSARLIPQVAQPLANALNLRRDQKSILIFTSDIDDIAFIACDAATKECDVEVVYCESMYAGSANANSAYAGDCIIVLAGPDPEEVRSAFGHIQGIHERVAFLHGNDEGNLMFLSYCISRSGRFLSDLCGLPEGASMAYCVGPPMECLFGLDAAIKAAKVEIGKYFAPPSHTNYGGAILTGSQAACEAACEAFTEAVMGISDQPIKC